MKAENHLQGPDRILSNVPERDILMIKSSLVDGNYMKNANFEMLVIQLCYGFKQMNGVPYGDMV